MATSQLGSWCGTKPRFLIRVSVLESRAALRFSAPSPCPLSQDISCLIPLAAIALAPPGPTVQPWVTHPGRGLQTACKGQNSASVVLLTRSACACYILTRLASGLPHTSSCCLGLPCLYCVPPDLPRSLLYICCVLFSTLFLGGAVFPCGFCWKK